MQSNQLDEKNLFLSVTYSEIQPYSGNHLLNLIKLNPTRDLSQTWVLEINIINNSKFEIQNIWL